MFNPILSIINLGNLCITGINASSSSHMQSRQQGYIELQKSLSIKNSKSKQPPNSKNEDTYVSPYSFHAQNKHVKSLVSKMMSQNRSKIRETVIKENPVRSQGNK